jgi:transposase
MSLPTASITDPTCTTRWPNSAIGTIEIVKRIAAGFELLPRRRVIERTLAWLNRNRRLAKDFEATLANATTWIYIASVNLLIRRLACLKYNYMPILIQTLRPS